MAAPGDGPSTAKDQDERFIAVLCRRARLQNGEIHKKREQLRKEIRRTLDLAYNVEAQYWHGYHNRLGAIAEANPNVSTRSWAGEFGDNEKQIVEVVEKRLANLHQDMWLKQEELTVLNQEFWSAWDKHVDFMSGLSTPPTSSGSTADAMLPDVAHQATGGETSGASPATHSSDNYNQSSSDKDSNTGDEQSAPFKSRAARGWPKLLPKLLPKSSTTAAEAVSVQDHSLTQATQGLGRSALQPVKSASPLATPSPLDLTYPVLAPTAGQLRRLRNATAAASAQKPSVPTPQSLTPESVFTAVDSPHESSKEPADIQPPAKRHKAAAVTPQPKMSFTPINTAEPSPPASSKSTSTAPHGQDDGFSGVTEPVVGEIYQAYYKDANYDGWWMCTLLPWDAWERQVGISFSFEKANLWGDLPEECYAVGRVRAKAGSRKTKKVIRGWKGDFEAGGSKVRERVFPMLMFEDVEGEPGNLKFPKSPEKSYTFPKSALKALPVEWIPAANLRLPSVDVGRPVGGRDTAERFRERVRARESLREDRKLGTPKKSRAVGLSGSAVASSPAATSSAIEASSVPESNSLSEVPSRYDTSREDTDMADAESLSGATAVEGDTAGELEAVDAAKTLAIMSSPPRAKAAPAADSAQKSSVRKWKDVVLSDDS